MHGLIAWALCFLVCLAGLISSSSGDQEVLPAAVPELDPKVPSSEIEANSLPNIYSSDFQPSGDVSLEPDSSQDESEEDADEESEIEPQNQFDWVKFFTGRYYENSYRAINEYLVKTVLFPKIEENLKAAKEWLAEETSKISAKQSWNLKPAKLGIVEALSQFTSLEKVLSKNCTWTSFSILYKNDRATRGKAHQVPSETGLLRRVEQIVHDIAQNHANYCKQEYPKIYQRLRTELGEDAHRVETFINMYVNHRLQGKRTVLFGSVRTPSSDGEGIVLARQINSLKGNNCARIAYECLKDFAKADPDAAYLNRVVDETNAKPTINEDKVAKLYNKYLVAPCKAFVEAMGPNVYTPVQYDMQVIEQEDRYQLDFKDYYDFYAGEIHYNLCNIFLRKSRKSLLKGILKNVSKAPIVTPKQIVESASSDS